MPYLELSSGTRMFYTDDGAGLPILSLHGWACDGSDWAWLVAALPDCRHIVPDLRGHGRSSAGQGAFTSRTLVQDLVELLDALGVHQAVVVGHSMGGALASALAADRRDLVSSLVLVDPALGVEDEYLESFIATLREDPLATAVEQFRAFAGVLTPPWLPVWQQRRVQAARPESLLGAALATLTGEGAVARRTVGEQHLKQLRCPVLTIWGNGRPHVVEWHRSHARAGFDVIEVWPEGGHFLHQEMPARFAARVGAWIESPNQLAAGRVG